MQNENNHIYLLRERTEYNIEGFDLILFKNKMILSSKKNVIITDSVSNVYKLEQFQYSINQEILKGENIIAITSDKENKTTEIKINIPGNELVVKKQFKISSFDFFLSISDEKKYSIAYVILQKKK